MRGVQVPIGSAKGRRFIGFFLFLALFFLPLHFHAAVTTPQLAKECSCVHGSRTDAGLTTAPAKPVPLVNDQLVQLVSQSKSASHLISSHFSRAPPLSLASY